MSIIFHMFVYCSIVCLLSITISLQLSSTISHCIYLNTFEMSLLSHMLHHVICVITSYKLCYVRVEIKLYRQTKTQLIHLLQISLSISMIFKTCGIQPENCLMQRCQMCRCTAYHNAINNTY